MRWCIPACSFNSAASVDKLLHSSTHSTMSTIPVERPYSHEMQIERASLLRKRLQFGSLSTWFRIRDPRNGSGTRKLWWKHFPHDPLTGSTGHSVRSAQERREVHYPEPPGRKLIPRAPTDFTPSTAPPAPASAPEWQPARKKPRLELQQQ